MIPHDNPLYGQVMLEKWMEEEVLRKQPYARSGSSKGGGWGGSRSCSWGCSWGSREVDRSGAAGRVSSEAVAGVGVPY